MQSNDNYGIYHSPSKAAIIAVICAGAALFFGSWAVQLQRRLHADLQTQNAATAAYQEKLAQRDRELVNLNSELRDVKSELREVKLRLELSPTNSGAIGGAANGETAPLPQTTSSAIVLPPAKIAAAENVAVINPVATVSEIPANVYAMAAGENFSGVTTVEIAPTVDELDDAEILSGEILTYNPDNQRVYLSLGSANGGVQPGNRFSIWRCGQYVTDVEVMKVFSVTSTCKITGNPTVGLQVGDVAKRARPVIGAL